RRNRPKYTGLRAHAKKMMVHKWRSQEQAILTGTKTIVNDNPQLTTRNWPGKSPLRVAIDRNLVISAKAAVFDNSADTLIINQLKDSVQGNIQFIKADFNNLPREINAILYTKNVQSVIVEGGLITLEGFIKTDNWDEARVFVSKSYFVKGTKAPKLNEAAEQELALPNSALYIYKQQPRAS
ncbi:MAG: riboflavin biosynthesis protein RibD, partial [Bacteroidales bacterium]|nr:riboflavin biosynthesis protein RibD [Bacteroidales bacterium]